MPSIEENYRTWTTYDWEKEGHEWSGAWGSTNSMWWGSIFPRIQSYLKNSSVVLEIAPGFGRCTEYLKDFSKELIIVDVSEKCIKSCEEKFKDVNHIQYFSNDGLSLDMVPNGNIDFIFTWDSLVHAEEDVLKSYINQFEQKLSKNGVAFMHHSNFLDANKSGNIKNVHWRAESVSANLVEKYCEEANLCCFSQELINWDGENLIDCITMITKKNSSYAKTFIRLENDKFKEESERIQKYSELYHLNINSGLTINEQDFSWISNLKRPVYLWGTGSASERNYTKLSEQSIEISGFIDSDEERQKNTFLELEVFDIQQILKENPFVIISSSYFEEISKVLTGYGYKENVDFLLYL